MLFLASSFLLPWCSGGSKAIARDGRDHHSLIVLLEQDAELYQRDRTPPRRERAYHLGFELNIRPLFSTITGSSSETSRCNSIPPTHELRPPGTLSKVLLD